MATYETDKDTLAQSSPGQTREKTGGARHSAGLYRHPQTGKEAITLEDPLYGNAQSEAFVRVGFERIRDAKPEEIKNLSGLAIEARKGSARTEMSEEDRTRIDRIENRQLQDENEKLKKQLEEAADTKTDEKAKEDKTSEQSSETKAKTDTKDDKKGTK